MQSKCLTIGVNYHLINIKRNATIVSRKRLSALQIDSRHAPTQAVYASLDGELFVTVHIWEGKDTVSSMGCPRNQT